MKPSTMYDRPPNLTKLWQSDLARLTSEEDRLLAMVAKREGQFRKMVAEIPDYSEDYSDQLIHLAVSVLLVGISKRNVEWLLEDPETRI